MDCASLLVDVVGSAYTARACELSALLLLLLLLLVLLVLVLLLLLLLIVVVVVVVVVVGLLPSLVLHGSAALAFPSQPSV
jgi:hypothetical protein